MERSYRFLAGGVHFKFVWGRVVREGSFTAQITSGYANEEKSE